MFLKIKIVLDGTKLVVGEERGIGFIYGGNITIPNTMTCTWWLGIGVVERHARWWNEIMKAIMGGFGELLYMYLQHIHCAPSPPEESVEDQNVCISPVPSMLLYGLHPHSPFCYPMVHRVIRVWFYQQWGPIELNCCIVFLH